MMNAKRHQSMMQVGASRIRIFKLFPAIFLAITVSFAQAQNYGSSDNFGKYVGTVQAEWLKDGRKMRLLAPFSYFDPNGHEWNAPSGSIVDGASIPRIAWSIIGGPFEGTYRDASVIHDIACEQKARAWEAVHEAFYFAMLASGAETWLAKVMYAAVYHFGPRWPRLVAIRGLPREQSPVARQKALEEADAGSTAEIIEIHPYGLPFPGTQKADFHVRITPPPIRLKEVDFEKLETSIKEGEKIAGTRSGGDPDAAYSLKKIRDFQPTQE